MIDNQPFTPTSTSLWICLDFKLSGSEATLSRRSQNYLWSLGLLIQIHCKEWFALTFYEILPNL